MDKKWAGVAVAKETLRTEYPHGHPKFFDITMDELKLHSDKNRDYARGGEPLGNFNRVADILGINYPNLILGDPKVIALVYAMKQLDAVLWMLNGGYQGNVESISSRLNDIAVYAKLVMCMLDDEKGEPNGTADLA